MRFTIVNALSPPRLPRCLRRGFFARAACVGFVLALVPGTNAPGRDDDGRIHLSYWEKWSGAEEDAMARTVDAFNRSQNRIYIDFLSVGQVEQKTLLATAGGDPPDLAGLFLQNVCSFADRHALTPLDGFIRADGETPETFAQRYAPAYREMGCDGGTRWGLPTTPTTTVLFWNKDLFRAAGLDPEKPPRTLAELETMSDRLTVRNARGDLKQLGFLPQLTGWVWAFPIWFGGQIFDGRNITIVGPPANLRAFQWAKRISDRYGLEAVRRISSSFGSLATPQDPFMSGQVAMVIDGVWRYDFIHKFAPGLDYGIAGWPAATPGMDDFTVAESDILVIPRGARHPHEAWEFLRYIASANLAAQSERELSGVELVCYYQKKASPLEAWSPFFTTHHPNSDIAIFRRLAESPHAIHAPNIGIWDDYQGEIGTAFDKMRLGLATPEQALAQCQARMEKSWAWHRESLARREPATPTP